LVAGLLPGIGGRWHPTSPALFKARLEFEMVDYSMIPDDARKFVAAARRLRDGLDRYGSMMAGLSTASDTVAADCHTLALAVPAEAVAVRDMLDALSGIMGNVRNTVATTAETVRGATDEFSKIIRVAELEIRKGSSDGTDKN
jgi:hypothetical protein